MAFTVPSVISISYVSPVRLSVTVSESLPVATEPLSESCVLSSAMLVLLCLGQRPNSRLIPAFTGG